MLLCPKERLPPCTIILLYAKNDLVLARTLTGVMGDECKYSIQLFRDEENTIIETTTIEDYIAYVYLPSDHKAAVYAYNYNEYCEQSFLDYAVEQFEQRLASLKNITGVDWLAGARDAPVKLSTFNPLDWTDSD